MTKMRQWTLMTVIAVVIVFAGGWLLLVKPQGTKISAVKAAASTQLQSNQVLLQEISARLAQKHTLPAEQAQLQKLAVQVPGIADEPAIIRELQSSASGAGVNLVTITPGAAAALAAPVAATPVTTTTATGTTAAATAAVPSATAGTLVELPLSIQVVGSYANVESYLQLLEKLPRAMLVTQFTLCPQGGQSGCTGVTLPANTTATVSAIGATLSADVFFAPTTAVAVPGATTTLPSTATTTPASPAATTTPVPTPTASAN